MNWAKDILPEDLNKPTQKQDNFQRNKRKRPYQNSKPDKEDKARPNKKPMELETDVEVLKRRQKQIDYGKNTVGYHNYISQVPSSERTKEHLKTPDKFSKRSRRSWDALIKIWRIKLHEFDPKGNNDIKSDSNKYPSTDDSEQ